MTKMYKGFNKDMTCRGFQFKEGETYETDTAELCRSGFHACENPLDCFAYYDPASSVFHEVELEATDEKQADDTKRVGKKIKIGARLSIAKMVDLSVAYIKEHLADDTNTNTGNRSAATNTGNYSAATNTGYRSAATNTGKGGVAIATGYRSKARGNTGSAICVCERGEWNGREFPLLAIKAAIVDGEIIKADTWYTCKDGELVEVNNDDD